jgi:hypothetical protein
MARAWRRWHQLGGRVRPVLGDASLVGKGRRPAAAVRWDSNPPSGARREPGVPGVMRTQRGPSGSTGPVWSRTPAALRSFTIKIGSVGWAGRCPWLDSEGVPDPARTREGMLSGSIGARIVMRRCSPLLPRSPT